MKQNSIWGNFRPENRWYNRGWEKMEFFDSHGRFRQKFHYVGEYYAIKPKERRGRCRIVVSLCTIVILIAYLVAAFTVSVGSRTRFIAIPMTAAMLPMLYFCIGAFWYVVSGERITYRRYYASELRLKRSAWITLICIMISALGELVLMVSHFTRLNISREAIYLGGMLICCGMIVVVLRTIRAYPMKMTK